MSFTSKRQPCPWLQDILELCGEIRVADASSREVTEKRSPERRWPGRLHSERMDGRTDGSYGADMDSSRFLLSVAFSSVYLSTVQVFFPQEQTNTKRTRWFSWLVGWAGCLVGRDDWAFGKRGDGFLSEDYLLDFYYHLVPWGVEGQWR